MTSSALRELTGNSVVWDNHACMPLRPHDRNFLPELERVHGAGIDIITINAAFGDDGPEAAEAMLASFHAWIAKHPDMLALVRTPADVEAVKSAGKLGICFDLESMTALGGTTERVAAFYDLGVRWMLAAYNRPNAAGGGCLEPDEGLTSFGKAVIDEMNRVGMAVCGSHCGHRTAREMIDHSATPVIFSHSNSSAVWDHPRNIPDDLMSACAARGGVIGINGFGAFLGPNDASTAAYIAHIEHALDLVGDDHVGIALDYVFDRDEIDEYLTSDPVTFPPELYPAGANMVEPWRLPEIALSLAAKGHTTDTLAKLFGGNHLRIAQQVWR